MLQSLHILEIKLPETECQVYDLTQPKMLVCVMYTGKLTRLKSHDSTVTGQAHLTPYVSLVYSFDRQWLTKNQPSQYFDVERFSRFDAESTTNLEFRHHNDGFEKDAIRVYQE